MNLISPRWKCASRVHKKYIYSWQKVSRWLFFTCLTFMCFFITLLAIPILNHSDAMSHTSFDHNLKQAILVSWYHCIKFTRLVSYWVLTKMTWKRLILPDCVISLQYTLPWFRLFHDTDHKLPWFSLHGQNITAPCLKPKAWILSTSTSPPYLARRQPRLCWSWGHWRALDGHILCFSGKSSSPGGEWGRLEDPRSRQDPE